MKVLIDTNILVSALLKDGLPESVILWVMNNAAWQWIASPAIMEEYREVLQRKKFKFSVEFVARWLALLDDSVVLYQPNRVIDFPRDRKDAKFLECAHCVKADLFITGDRDFEEAQTLTDTVIISAANFEKLFISGNLK